ncbi:hypothetical protein P872_04100 [Rhodonellum psychrophilum GCM71 = DSM 17998]|uniref:Uncharacterized protein n=1 Tax=Rhodonellum psychrophilum GCM71 = DSM 17998 TaxID=1123057 RepID=U5C199_9BACT|nr:hypothetical protein P872_04100 [Rhodonellum psychrophilum GCM71 = DSM 17998]
MGGFFVSLYQFYHHVKSHNLARRNEHLAGVFFFKSETIIMGFHFSSLDWVLSEFP